jgi:hypothetical protein
VLGRFFNVIKRPELGGTTITNGAPNLLPVIFPLLSSYYLMTPSLQKKLSLFWYSQPWFEYYLYSTTALTKFYSI